MTVFDRIDAVRDQFIARIDDWLPGIEDFARDLAAGLMSNEDVAKLRSQTHKISGSAEIFGFPELSRVAQQLESHLVAGQEVPCEIRHSGAFLAAVQSFLDAARLIVTDKATATDSRNQLALHAPAKPIGDTSLPTGLVAPRRPIHVMIVDDDDLTRSFMIEELSKHGWIFTEAVNGKEAILHLFRLGDAPAAARPDVIVLDVDMPEMDGHETLRQIKAAPAWATIPVMMLTARDEDVSLIRGLSSGALEYLRKPYDTKLLAKIICDVLARSTRSVMVAGAEPALGAALRERLRDLGLVVSVIADGRRVLEQARDDQPSVVVIDSSLTDGDGNFLLQMLRSDVQTRHIPLIALEAEGDRAAMLANLRGGVAHSVMRPVAPEEVLARVQGLLGLR